VYILENTPLPQPMSFRGKMLKGGREKRGKWEEKGENTEEKGEIEVKKGQINTKRAIIKPKMAYEEYIFAYKYKGRRGGGSKK
jgi:hypothetical protein